MIRSSRVARNSRDGDEGTVSGRKRGKEVSSSTAVSGAVELDIHGVEDRYVG